MFKNKILVEMGELKADATEDRKFDVWWKLTRYAIKNKWSDSLFEYLLNSHCEEATRYFPSAMRDSKVGIREKAISFLVLKRDFLQWNQLPYEDHAKWISRVGIEFGHLGDAEKIAF